MFDPYHKWLGIPPGKRPPTLYQLLAIAEGEKDRDVIEAATVRQSAYVRNFQKGPNADEAAKLLAEISDARAILTDPLRRKTYDEKLAALKPKPAPVAAVAAQPVVVRAAPVVKAPPAAKPGRARSGKRRSSNAPVIIILSVICISVATGVGVYLATRGSGGQPTAAASTELTTTKSDDGIRSPKESPLPANVGVGPQPAPVNQDQKPNEPNPWPNPNAGRVPMGPPPGFGQPPNFGGPGRMGPPSGFARGIPGPPNVTPPNMFPTDGARDAAKSSTKSEPPKKRDESKDEDVERGGVDGALAQLRKEGFFDIDKGCKYLALVKPDAEHKSEVAKTLNNLLVLDSHLPETIYDAAAVWGDSDTVKIIADKLAMRPFPPRGAFRAAGRMKNSQFVGLIVLQLDNIHALDEATRALQAMGPVAESGVRTLLTHRDVNMRIRACTILGSVGTEKSVLSLRRAASERATAAAAKAALLQVSERVKEKKASEDKEFE